MRYAVVTGASSGIGMAMSGYLITQGYTVLGVGRHIQAQEGMIPIVCDLSKPAMIEAVFAPLAKTHEIHLLINAAGFGHFQPHEELSASVIEAMMAVNLAAPMILCNLFLRSIKRTQGMILNITSIEATRHAKFSAAYSATKAGLRAFGLSLFEEVRKSGVKVVTLNPDMTHTPFFETLRFRPKSHAALDTAHLVEVLDMLLHLPSQAAITELTIRPQYFELEKK